MKLKNTLIKFRNLIDYKMAMMKGRPYFGGRFYCNQIKRERKQVMAKLVVDEMRNKNNFKILEIGSWAGESAVLWASFCKKYNKGKVYCIDSWKPYKSISKEMNKCNRNNKILKLFLYNIKASGCENFVVPIKSTSDEMSDIFPDNIFDLVFIDGDHSYTQCRKDIMNYKNKVKEKGILCGDDLELIYQEIDKENAELKKEKDYITDPKTNKNFHPGLTLAIHEIIGKVSRRNGFWAVRKQVGKWKEINLI